MNSNIVRKSIFQKTIFVAGATVFFCALVAFLLPLLKSLPMIFYPTKNAFNFFKILKTTGYTFLQAIVSVFISLIVGLPGAYILSHKKFFGQSFLKSLGAVPLCIPPLIVVLGYISTFGMNGIFNRFFMTVFNLTEAPIKFLYSFWGIVFVQGFYNFPLIMVSVADSWETLDRSQLDAAKILGAKSGPCFFQITLPQLFPSIVSSCIPVFIYCFFSFMVVLLFGTPGTSTLELEIYHAGRSTLDFALSTRLSLIETFVALSTIFLWTAFEKKIRRNHSVVLKNHQKTKINAGQKFPVAIYFFCVTIFFLVPLFSILYGSLISKTGGKNSLSFSGWIRVFKFRDFFPSLKNTLTVAFFTSVFCTVCGFFCSSFIRLSKKSSSILTTVSILPMAVSSVTVGIGFSLLFKKSSPIVLVAAQTALTWPFAFRQIHSQMIRIPQTVLDASDILSKNKLDKVFKILVPYTWRGIVSASGFCFAISCGDATLPLVLSMQKFSTLSLFTYRLAGSYRFTEACVSGLLLGLLCSLIFGLSKKIGGGTKNVF